jgi:hypothetical protein
MREFSEGRFEEHKTKNYRGETGYEPGIGGEG